MFCLGNHDYGSCYPGKVYNDPFEFQIIKEAFSRNGIELLTNEANCMTYQGSSFNVVGLHDIWSNLFSPRKAFAKLNLELPTIVLSHNPDTIHLVEQDFDIMLAGHSHGGQVSWPIVGAFLMPQESKQFQRGMHSITNRKRLYVNRGLGYTFKMRLNSYPEITVFHVK